MKRVIVALSLLAFAVVSAFVFTKILIDNINSVSADVSHLGSVSQTASEKELIDETRAVIAKWNNAQKFLKIISVHENLTEINRTINSLDDISSSGNRELLCEKCNEIRVMLSIFESDERISVENIF